MIHFAWNRIKNRKFVSVTIVFAFLSVFLLIPIGIQNTKETKLTVQNSIAEHGRGSYDLLIRPKTSRTNIEKEVGIVEENYIGDSQGGISIEEWQQLKSNPEIEVAAPVASIGYFTGKRLSVDLPQFNQSTRFIWEFYTTDGLNNYSLNKPQSLIYFKESQPGMIQFLKDLNLGETASGAMMEIMIPSTYHLLAAIDSESEQKLANIDFSQLENEIDPAELQGIQNNFRNVPIIKVIQRKDMHVPLSLKLKAETLDIDLSEYRTKLGLSEQDWLMSSEEAIRKKTITELNQKKAITSVEHDIDLSSFQSPFNSTPVQINEQFKPLKASKFAANRAETSVYFIAHKLKYEESDEAFNVNIVEDGSPPSYKDIEKRGKNLYEPQNVPYLLEQVGTFSAERNEKKELSSSPLGIYSTTNIKTAQGQLLKATTIPGSFIPQAAGALISMESAEMIKGPKPIDAIRIRVAGIDEYNSKAQEKIETVAIDLLKSGYEVDIVAGSSFVNQTLNVEGIGKVIAPWTTLGVAQELEENWNQLTFITTILFVAFAFVWFIARLSFEKNILKNEDDLLSIIGWQRKQIVKRNYAEQYFLLITAYLISLILIPLLPLDLNSYIFTTIILLSGLLIISIVFSIKNKQKKRFMAYKRASSILYYRNILIPTMVVLFVSTILLIIQLSSIGDGIVNARKSTLGQFTVDVTMWFQISILISSFILSALGLSECLHVLFQYRSTEIKMYQIIGWTKTRIFHHLGKEVFLWTTISIFAGIITAFVVLLILKYSIFWITISIAISSILLCCLVVGVTIKKILISPSTIFKDKNI